MTSADPMILMSYAAQKGRLLVVPFMPLVRKAKVVRRKVPVDPGDRPKTTTEGRLLLATPRQVAENIRGPEEDRDIYLLVHVPRQTYEEMVNPSPIIQPHGVG